MKSMTAFSRQEITASWGSVNLEMRTVNHRYLDLNIRLAEELRFFEPMARKLLADSLTRGRIELSIKYQPTVANQISLNQSTVDQLLGLQAQLQAQQPGLAPLSTAEILNWPGTLEMTSQDEDEMARAMASLLQAGIKELCAQREAEGEKIKKLLMEKNAAAQAVITRIREILPEVSQLFRERFQDKLSQMDVDIDSHRLEQELVIFLGKQDIAEELDRLDVHLLEVGKIIGVNQAAGRRLDFLMQELNREANTLTSKSVDVRLNNAAVEIKVLIEQMREQVQNIE